MGEESVSAVAAASDASAQRSLRLLVKNIVCHNLIPYVILIPLKLVEITQIGLQPVAF